MGKNNKEIGRERERERGNALRPNITFDNYYHRFIDYVIVFTKYHIYIYMYVCMYVYFMMYMTFVYSECNGFVNDNSNDNKNSFL